MSIVQEDVDSERRLLASMRQAKSTLKIEEKKGISLSGPASYVEIKAASPGKSDVQMPLLPCSFCDALTLQTVQIESTCVRYVCTVCKNDYRQY